MIKFDSVNKLLSPVKLPEMFRLRQHFNADVLEDPEAELLRQLSQEKISSLFKPGMRIAITAGSRGIDNYLLCIQVLVRFIRSKGAEPFVIPAMGSHGGATAEGQKALLAGYGITEESVGAPIISSMETVRIGEIDGEEVRVDKNAHEADGIVLLNRVKPHTGFRAKHESGLVKMAAIGLGKQYGAQIVHAGGPENMGKRVFAFGDYIIDHEKILCGVGLVENAFDKTEQLFVAAKDEIEDLEAKALEKAKSNMPSILLEDLDILIVDRVGKNISGPGMDPNVTYSFLPNAPIPEELRAKRAKRIVVLSLTKETHGNAMGIGMADITTRRVFDSMDFDATYPNCLTSGVTVSAKVPMFFDSDELAVKAAAMTMSCMDASGLRVVRILDTLHLSEIEASAALLAEAEADPRIEVLSAPAPMPFDDHGDLL